MKVSYSIIGLGISLLIPLLARVKELLNASQGEKEETSDQIASLQKTIEDLKDELNQRHTLEQAEQLEKANRELEQRNKELDERNAELEGIIKKQVPA